MRGGVRGVWWGASVLLVGCSLSHERSQGAQPNADAAVGNAEVAVDAAIASDADGPSGDAVVARDAASDDANELVDNWELCSQLEVRPDPVTGRLPCTIAALGLTQEEVRYVNLAFTPQPDAPEQWLLRAVDASKCREVENAYLVEGDDPPMLQACPATCALWQASPNGRLNVYLACIGPVIE